MKAFWVGSLFLCAVFVLAGIGVVLSPLIILLSFLLRIIISLALVIFAIWLLGKFIIFIWEKLKNVK